MLLRGCLPWVFGLAGQRGMAEGGIDLATSDLWRLDPGGSTPAWTFLGPEAHLVIAGPREFQLDATSGTRDVKFVSSVGNLAAIASATATLWPLARAAGTVTRTGPDAAFLFGGAWHPRARLGRGVRRRLSAGRTGFTRLVIGADADSGVAWGAEVAHCPGLVCGLATLPLGAEQHWHPTPLHREILMMWHALLGDLWFVGNVRTTYGSDMPNVNPDIGIGAEFPALEPERSGSRTRRP